MMIDRNCPSCKNEIKISAGRWHGKTQCPHCLTWLYVDYDMIYDEDDGDEWDLYDLKILDPEEHSGIFLDIFEATK